MAIQLETLGHSRHIHLQQVESMTCGWYHMSQKRQQAKLKEGTLSPKWPNNGNFTWEPYIYAPITSNWFQVLTPWKAITSQIMVRKCKYKWTQLIIYKRNILNIVQAPGLHNITWRNITQWNSEMEESHITQQMNKFMNEWANEQPCNFICINPIHE